MYVLGVRSPSLGYYRPNQAIQRGLYTRKIPLAGLGCNCPRKSLGDASIDPSTGNVSVDPTTLLIGLGAIGALFFLVGGRTVPAAKRVARRGLSSLQRRLS